MKQSAHEGIAHTRRIYHTVDIIDRCLQQLIVSAVVAGEEQGREQVMTGSYHVAHTHQPFLATWEFAMQVVKPFAVFIHLHLETRVHSREGRLLALTNPFKLDGVAKHQVTVAQHPFQCLTRVCTVLPQILAIVDVEGNLDAHLIGNVECFEGGIRRTL